MRYVLLALVLLIAACATARTNVLNQSYLPISEQEVTIVGDREDIPDDMDCVTVAYIEAEDIWFNNTQKMINKVRSEAAKLGANYVVFRGIESDGSYGGGDEANAIVYHCE
jgi:hypothetical protein